MYIDNVIVDDLINDQGLGHQHGSINKQVKYNNQFSIGLGLCNTFLH